MISGKMHPVQCRCQPTEPPRTCSNHSTGQGTTPVLERCHSLQII